MKHTIEIIIPTYNGGESFKSCLKSLESFRDSITIVDSGSTDGSLELSERLGLKVLKIKQSDYNHGATREWARKSVVADVIVFLTQDVIIRSLDAIQVLVEPITTGNAEATYGRQVAVPNAGFFERFPRQYNYSEMSHIRSIEDIPTFGSFTFFCSDSFAAYSQKALDEVGGFGATLSHEDYFAVAKIMKRGGRIAYVAEAEVVHSHCYSLWQEFQRYFDAGYVRAVNPWVTELVGHAENHGSRFFKTMLFRLAKEDPKLIPYAFIQTSVKWLGFRTGFVMFKGPTWLKKLLSGQSYYFDSNHYIPGKN